MFHFGDNIKAINITGITIGGQPGENQPVLIGALPSKALYDLELAEKLIIQQDSYSKSLGLPCMTQVLTKRLQDFNLLIQLSELIITPILLDSPFGREKDLSNLLNKIEHLDLSERIVWNSIHENTQEAEIKAISDLGIKSVVLLAHNMSLPSADGSVHLLKHGLLDKVLEYNFQNVLIDPGSLPIGTGFLAGEFFAALMLLKSHFEYPVGGAPCNIVEAWSEVNSKNPENGEENLFLASLCAVNSMAMTMGADFLMYGSLKHAPEVFISAKITSEIIYERMHRYFGVERSLE